MLHRLLLISTRQPCGAISRFNCDCFVWVHSVWCNYCALQEFEYEIRLIGEKKKKKTWGMITSRDEEDGEEVEDAKTPVKNQL